MQRGAGAEAAAWPEACVVRASVCQCSLQHRRQRFPHLHECSREPGPRPPAPPGEPPDFPDPPAFSLSPPGPDRLREAATARSSRRNSAFSEAQYASHSGGSALGCRPRTTCRDTLAVVLAVEGVNLQMGIERSQEASRSAGSAVGCSPPRHI